MGNFRDFKNSFPEDSHSKGKAFERFLDLMDRSRIKSCTAARLTGDIASSASCLSSGVRSASSAAAVLLSGLPIDAPVDVYLSRHFHQRELRALVADPILAVQDGGESDVEHSALRKAPPRMVASECVRLRAV